jgi:hypothetical protein
VNPAVPTINGSGKPRLIFLPQSGVYVSAGATTYDSTHATEAGTPDLVGAGIQVGQTIVSYKVGVFDLQRVYGVITAINNSTGVITVSSWVGGTPVAGVPFAVWEYAYVSSGGTTYDSTGATETGTPDFSQVEANAYITSDIVVAGAPLEPTYAKVTGVGANRLTVDAWVPDVPTNGLPFYVTGYIADLPRTQELPETFTPDNIVHQVYRRRKLVKHYGYQYKALLDFSKYVSGDTMLLLKRHLAAGQGDRIILIPRVDAPENQYNVYLSKQIDLSLYGEGLGHRKVSLEFSATENVGNLPSPSGYGTGYGKNYGHQL